MNWRCIILVALCLVGVGHAFAAPAIEPLQAQAANVARNQTHGLALGVGFGYPAASLGGIVSYYLPLSIAPAAVTPYLGVGARPAPGGLAVGGAVGASVSYGLRHRMVLDLGYGMGPVEELSLHGTRVDEHVVYGVQMGMGYEYLGDRGLLVRCIPALFRPVTSRYGDTEPDLFITVSAGWKLW